MNLASYLTDETILLNCVQKNKEELLQYMVEEACKKGGVVSSETIFGKIQEREKVRSTGFGRGLAVAHARIESCKELFVVIARPLEPIQWEAIDSKPVYFVLLVVGPDALEVQYLQILSEVTKIWARKETRALLQAAQTPSEIVQIISEAKNRTHPR